MNAPSGRFSKLPAIFQLSLARLFYERVTAGITLLALALCFSLYLYLCSFLNGQAAQESSRRQESGRWGWRSYAEAEMDGQGFWTVRSGHSEEINQGERQVIMRHSYLPLTLLSAGHEARFYVRAFHLPQPLASQIDPSMTGQNLDSGGECQRLAIARTLSYLELSRLRKKHCVL